MNKIISAALALPLLASSFNGTLLPVTPALAAPMQMTCILKTYFSDSQHTDQIGTSLKCLGSPTQSHGRTSRYYTIERISGGPAGGGPSGGGGHGSASLPCEFLVSGCPNWPLRRPYY